MTSTAGGSKVYRWTVKSGEPTFVDGVDTRARPGTVVHGRQTAPTGSNAHAR